MFSINLIIVTNTPANLAMKKITIQNSLKKQQNEVFVLHSVEPGLRVRCTFFEFGLRLIQRQFSFVYLEP